MRVVRLTGEAIGWLLLVAAVVAGVWFAVDAAAGQVGGSGSAAGATQPALLATTEASPSLAATTPAASPTPSTAVSATAAGSPSPSPSPSASPGRGVYTSEPGDITLHCAGSHLLSWSMRPGVGWRMDSVQVADSVVEVTFSQDGRRSVTVRATCRPTGPTFATLDGTASPSPSASATG